MNFTILAKTALLIAAAACLTVSATAQTVLEPTATFMAAADNAAAVTAQDLFVDSRPTTIIPNPDNPNLPAVFTTPREVSTAGDSNFAVRQRINQESVGLLWQSFFSYDISGLTAADLAAPNVVTIETIATGIASLAANRSISLGVAIVPAGLKSGDLLAQEYIDPASLTATNFADEDGNVPSNLIARGDEVSADITSFVLDAVNAGETELLVVMFGALSETNVSGGFGDNSFAFDAPTLTVGPSDGPIVLLGDANCDETVDFLDIAPFIALLSNGEFKAEADIDNSGVVDFLDIAPFIAILP